ncbi:hypothetical protein MYP_1272 [Sporocytophaga myxococcoides]|uniref:Uncharacterized protein n=1 Tax=Sporocytophaga myxococcoides TaxID=153721 RepID=A0A098LC77_9BACT|nr:hypothetical protein MYP_1272 [Sporocytophaga myxococcoides]
MFYYFLFRLDQNHYTIDDCVNCFTCEVKMILNRRVRGELNVDIIVFFKDWCSLRVYGNANLVVGI